VLQKQYIILFSPETPPMRGAVRKVCGKRENHSPEALPTGYLT
jgi:hypothetical protein